MKLRGAERKYISYIKYKIKTIETKEVEDQINEWHMNIKNLLADLWKMDSSLCVLPWKEGTSTRILIRNSEIPQSKEAMELYMSYVFTRQG